MFAALHSLAQPAVMQRATLLINHVLASEPVALQHLRAHTGRSILLQFEGWPSLLPPLPVMAFRVTPAALLEWGGPDAPPDADLRVTIDASNPALGLVQALSGKRPRVEVAGDAALAADVNWLFANLRWDVQDDLARLAGDMPARELARLGALVAEGLRAATGALGGLAQRARGGQDANGTAPGHSPR
jgi:ubiquinone biosynthesis accessory factor UbiJ